MDVEKLAAHTRGIRALARSLLRDEAQVDDVIQEASLAALRLPETPARGWWIKVVRNLALRQRRSEGRRARREQAVARREGTPATSEVVARAEVHRRLVACVLDLDEPYRSTLLFRYFDSLSLKEIAARLGIPVATVSTRVRRALALLRGRLDASPGGRRAWCLSLLPLAGLTPRSPLPLGVAVMSTKKILSLTAVALLLATLLLTFHHFGSQAPQETRTQAGARHDVSADTADADTAVTAPAPDRDLDLHGVVVDPAGRPVAGATVTAFWDPWKRARVGDPTKGSRFEDGPTATTDADGRFALRLRRGQRVNLRVNAEGFARRELNYLQAGERIRIVLTPGVTLIVDVQDHEGRPAVGASLHLLRGERDGLDRIDRRGTTDERGRHRFGGLPPAAWAMLNGRHAELGNLPWQMRVGFPARGERVHVVRIPPGRTLRGVVLDDETGAPVAGARLSGSWTIDFLVRTDEAGRFEMPGWGSNSEFMVSVAADGYVRTSRRIVLADDLEFRLVRGWSVAGRVVDAQGRPVPGARVGAMGRDAQSLLSFGEARSGADGRFEFGDLTLDTRHTVAVIAPGHGRTLLDIAPPDEGMRRDIGDIALPSPRRVEGRVLWPDGTVAAGVIVELTGGNDDRGRLGVEPGRMVSAGSTEVRRTDDLGRFRFGDLAPGSYRLSAQPPGGKRVERDLTLEPARDATGVELRLIGRHELAVTVVDDSGAPARVFVSVSAEDKWSFSRETDTEGVARFFSDARFVQARVFSMAAPVIPPPPIAIPPGSEAIRVTVRRAIAAHGRVLDIEGRPFPQAVYRVFENGEPLDLGSGSPFVGNEGFTDVHGRFQVPVPVGASVDLVLTGMFNPGWVEGRKYEPFAGELLDVRPGARDLVLRARSLIFDRILRVRVLGPDGEPLQGAQVFATYLGKHVAGANVLSDARGRAILQGMPRAQATVYAKPLSKPAHWMKASARAEPEAEEIEIRIKEGVVLSGVVLENDEPVAGVSVSFVVKDWPKKTVTTDAKGRFEMLVDPDREGPLMLWAYRWDKQGRRFEARIENFRPDSEPRKLRLKPAE